MEREVKKVYSTDSAINPDDLEEHIRKLGQSEGDKKPSSDSPGDKGKKKTKGEDEGVSNLYFKIIINCEFKLFSK